MITFDELKQAAKVFDRINDIRNYVTKDRFAMVAQVRFGITNESKIDVMYGLLNMTPKMIHSIALFDSEEARRCRWLPEYIDHLPKTIEIAEAAYAMKPDDWEQEHVPHIEHNQYRQSDRRRYYYTENGSRRQIDIPLSSRYNILLLAELLKRDGVTLVGVAEHLGYLEGEIKGQGREKFQYFEGDIYLLYGNPNDRVFYSYVDSDDAGVYVATQEGWRKLLYTPTRGYVERDGELSFVDEEHFYSDYMLEASGKGFLYVGNIHDDMSVLVEKENEE
jgi:hypothetical protein